jgi:hypothetical protein
MSCTRGCCDTPAEHYRSLRVASPDRRQLTKTVTDVHDHHKVDVTQHWHDRQDVQVRLDKPVQLRHSAGRLENTE